MKKINVLDYGLSHTRADNTEALHTMIQSLHNGNEEISIIFPEGTFRFGSKEAHQFELPISNHSDSPRKSIFHLENLKNIQIQGTNTRLLFTGNIIPFSIIDCSQIGLMNLTVDFTDPFCLQGTVTESRALSYTLKMDEDLPLRSTLRGFTLITDEGPVKGKESIEWDHARRRRKYRTRPSFIMTGSSQIQKDGYCRVLSAGSPQVGNKIITRVGDRTQPGFLIHNSKKIRLSQINIHHSKAMGILAQMSECIELSSVAVVPAPDSGRLFSSRDDAFHFSNCRESILLKNCKAIGQMDDGLNVHGTYFKAEKLTGSLLRLSYGHSQSKGFNPFREGDLICLRDRETLQELGRAFCLNSVQTTENTIEILLQSSVSVPRFSIAENLSTAPDLTVEDSEFRNNRARGILVTTRGKVRIRNNYISPTGAAILIAGDAVSWFESGGVQDVIIENNTMELCNTEPFQYCRAIISIFPELKRPAKSSTVHTNIKIRNNHIRTFDAPILFASNSETITFENNQVEKTNEYEPWQNNKDAFFFKYCKNIFVGNNNLDPALISRKFKEIQ